MERNVTNWLTFCLNLGFKIDLGKLLCYFINIGDNMNKKNIMLEFISTINDRGLMTSFIRDIFDYDNFYDYNYFFRMIDMDNKIILDIYDNVSDTKLNRYVFSFDELDDNIKIENDGSIFVHYISVLNIKNSDKKLMKLAYLFNMDEGMMLEYADSFLDKIFVEILREILK